jgi:sugar phosphate isomerase/epimerase
VKIIMDGANLFQGGDFSHMREVLDEAFTLLGDDIVIAHAKDLIADGAGGIEWRAAGQGSLDYDYYLTLLHGSGYVGPLILHGLEERQVDDCTAFLFDKLDSASRGAG